MDNTDIAEILHQRRSFHQWIILLFVIMKEIDLNIKNIFGLSLQIDIDKQWICPKFLCNSINPIDQKRCQQCSHQKPKPEKLIINLLKKIWNIKHNSMFNEKPIKHLIILLVKMFNEDQLVIYKNKKKDKNASELLKNLKPNYKERKTSSITLTEQQNIQKEENQTWEQYLTWNKMSITKTVKKDSNSIISLLSTAITGESKFNWYLRMDMATTIWEYKPLMCEIMDIDSFNLNIHLINLIQNQTRTIQAHIIAFAIKYNTNVTIKKYVHTLNSIINICDTTQLIQYALDNNLINIDINDTLTQLDKNTPMILMQKNQISLKTSQFDVDDALLSPTNVPTLFQKIANTGTDLREITKNIQMSQKWSNIQLANKSQTIQQLNLPRLINISVIKKHNQKLRIQKISINNKHKKPHKTTITKTKMIITIIIIMTTINTTTITTKISIITMKHNMKHGMHIVMIIIIIIHILTKIN